VEGIGKRLLILLAIILVVLGVIFFKMRVPSTCPSYIDLSLDREIVLFDKIAGVGVLYDKREFYPENVYVIGDGATSGGQYEGDKYVGHLWENEEYANEIIYVDGDVLYLVDYKMKNIDGELFKYITKMAVKNGDPYIYKVDNWSGSGLMVTQYCDVYLEYFKEALKNKSISAREGKFFKYAAAPKHLDLEVKSRVETFNSIYDVSFNDSSDPLKLASEFVPLGATVYSARDYSSVRREIIYVTKDGVCYKEIYSEDTRGKRYVEIHATAAQDNYVYWVKVYSPKKFGLIDIFMKNKTGNYGDDEIRAHTKATQADMAEYIDLWRAERGLTLQPPIIEESDIYLKMGFIRFRK